MQYKELYEAGCKSLMDAGVEEYSLDARLLLEFVCDTDRNTLFVHPDKQVEPALEEKYRALIVERAKRIPLQHLLGTQEFMGLTFKVNEHVLIPRQDTEILVEEAMQFLHDGMNILDMCTGSGCILLSLLHYSNDCTGVGVDLSEAALQVARSNGVALQEENASFVQSDLFEQVEGSYDMIVSNPPYIATKEIETLMPEVREHEPMMALDGTEDGLFFYREITKKCGYYLKPGGYLLYEIGYDQGDAVKALMEQAGFLDVEVLKDYAGLDRVVRGYKSVL